MWMNKSFLNAYTHTRTHTPKCSAPRHGDRWVGATQSFPFSRLCSGARPFSVAASFLSCCWSVGRRLRSSSRSSFCPGSWASRSGPSGRCWEPRRPPACRNHEWSGCRRQAWEQRQGFVSFRCREGRNQWFRLCCLHLSAASNPPERAASVLSEQSFHVLCCPKAASTLFLQSFTGKHWIPQLSKF